MIFLYFQILNELKETEFKLYTRVFCTLLFAATGLFHVNNYINIDPILAAALFALFGVITLKLIKQYALASSFYCGIFIGMSNYYSQNSLSSIILACALATLLIIVFRNRFIGYGGKLGTIAFLSSLPGYFLLC